MVSFVVLVDGQPAPLEGLSLREWSELLYHAAEYLHGLESSASCYAARASASITQTLADRRKPRLA